MVTQWKKTVSGFFGQINIIIAIFSEFFIFLTNIKCVFLSSIMFKNVPKIINKKKDFFFAKITNEFILDFGYWGYWCTVEIRSTQRDVCFFGLKWVWDGFFFDIWVKCTNKVGMKCSSFYWFGESVGMDDWGGKFVFIRWIMREFVLSYWWWKLS